MGTYTQERVSREGEDGGGRVSFSDGRGCSGLEGEGEGSERTREVALAGVVFYNFLFRNVRPCECTAGHDDSLATDVGP